MNRQQRKQITLLKVAVEALRFRFAEMAEVEQDKYDSLPVEFQEAANGQQIYDAQTYLTEISESFDEIIERIEYLEG